MDRGYKINRLAIVSFVSGLVALLSISLIFILYNVLEISGSIITITDGIIMPLRNLSVVVALLTGILALREIKKADRAEKGVILAWVGIVIGAGWILFGLLVGLMFLLSDILG
jgi:hypothetical protein